jgi:hypothetical protein
MVFDDLKPLEMITVSRMQNMVEIRKKKTYFATKSLKKKKEVLLGLSALRAPTVGPFKSSLNHVTINGPTVAPKNDSPKGSQKK